MKVFGKYEVHEELDSRASISVFRGRDRIIQREVLLKLFHMEPMAPPARQRFVREVRATVALTHPNIVSIYDFGVQDEYAYLAMEQLDGESLRDFLNRKGHRTLESKLQFMIEVCEALAFAHNQGVLHRDIRPENIFVLKSGRPKILDFAIRYALLPMSLPEDVDMTNSDYLAPEQFRRQRGDALSDVFSASLVFFELVTNTLPFQGMDITRKIQVDAAPLMTKADPALPRQLAKLIARGLSLDPAERIPSAAAFVQDLRMIAAEQVILSSQLAEEVIGLREQIMELRKRLSSDSPQIQARLSEVDFSILERLTPELASSISADMDYFSIVDLQKECLETLSSIDRIVAENADSQEMLFSEINLSLKAAAEKVSAPGKVMSVTEEKLGQLEYAVTTGNITSILKLVTEVGRLKKKWYAEYSATETDVENLEGACHKALATVVQITQREIHAAISRGDIAGAEKHFQNIDQVCAREPGYSELATQIREQIQSGAKRSDRGEPRGRIPKVELISEAGRMCTGCKHSNPMEAVICESCGLRLPGTRRLSSESDQPSSRTKRAMPKPDVVVSKTLLPGRIIAAAGAVVLSVVIAAYLLMPKSPKVTDDLPVIGIAVIAKDAALRLDAGVEDKATSVAKGEGVELLGKLPDRNPDAWAEIRVKSDGRTGYVRIADMDFVHTDTCSFDLWHASLPMPGIDSLDRTQRLERVRQVETEMSRCPESATDDLRVTVAETYMHEASALPWESAQGVIKEARSLLASIQDRNNFGRRIEDVNRTLDGLAPAQETALPAPPLPPTPARPTPARSTEPAPAPVKSENVDVAERLLKQAKIDLENAETRVQLNSVIANMNAITNMSFTERRGLAIQAEARKIMDKATNSLGLVK